MHCEKELAILHTRKQVNLGTINASGPQGLIESSPLRRIKPAFFFFSTPGSLIDSGSKFLQEVIQDLWKIFVLYRSGRWP